MQYLRKPFQTFKSDPLNLTFHKSGLPSSNDDLAQFHFEIK